MSKPGWAISYAFTLMNLFCGLMAIIYGLNDQLIAASWLIIVAGLMDGLDGKIARFTGSSTQFGVEFDSMADLISFGIAPPVLLYKFNLWHTGWWGWLLIFAYTCTGAYRLARFNYHYKGVRKDFFRGLPITMAGMTIASLIIFFTAFPTGAIDTHLLGIVILLLSGLMASTLHYEGLPRFSMATRKDTIKIIVLFCCGVAIAFQPDILLFPLMLGYMFLGIMKWLISSQPVHTVFKSNMNTQHKAKRE